MNHRTLALASLLASTPAFADAVIAVRDEASELISVHKVTASGLTKVVQDPGDVVELAWSDARTLWVLYRSDSSDHKAQLGKIVDGKIEKLTVDPGPLKVGKDSTLETHLVSTRTGQVWLHYCLEMGDLDCKRASWLRVDLPKQKVTSKVPAGIGPANPPVFPAVKAPKGFSVALKQVVVDGNGEAQKKLKTKGAVCTGPAGAKTWPDTNVDIPFAMRPAKVTWVRADPVVARVEGKATNPVGQVSDEQIAFVGCKDVYDEVVFFGDGAWGLRKDSSWQIYVEAKPVAKLTVTTLLPAPTK